MSKMFRSSRSLGLLADAAAEDLEDTTGTTEVTDNDLVDVMVEEPAEEIAAAEELATEMDEFIDAAETGVDVTDEMSSIQGNLEQSAAEGGMDQYAAEAMRTALNVIAALQGVNGLTSLSMEGAKRPATRAATTKQVAEGVGEIAKRIWDAIVKAYNAAVEWVKKWFNRFFTATGRLKARAEKIIKVAKAKGNKTTAEKINKPALAEALSLNGKVQDSAGAISTALKGMAKKIQSKNDIGTDAEQLLTQAADLIDIAIKGESGAFESKLAGLVQNEKSKHNEVYTDAKGESPEGMEYLLVEKFFNNKVAVLTWPKETDAESVKQYIGRARIEVVTDKGQAQVRNVEMAALSAADCVKVAEDVRDIATLMINSAKGVDKLTAAQKKVKDYAARGAKGSKDEAKDMIRVAAAYSRAVLGITTSGLTTIRGMAVSQCGSCLSYCAESLSLMGKTTEKEDKKGAEADAKIRDKFAA